jgi:ribosomal protein S18 acetylase RimI-like enzyme
MKIVTAELEDIPAWICLAAEVEPLFGPLVNDPQFHAALEKNIRRGTAFCVRKEDGPPGEILIGGMLFSMHPPVYTIGWLAVSKPYRHLGIGKLLVDQAMQLVTPPAELVVETFGPNETGSQDARKFYEELGFHAEELIPTRHNPNQKFHQIYRKKIEHGI